MGGVLLLDCESYSLDVNLMLRLRMASLTCKKGMRRKMKDYE